MADKIWKIIGFCIVWGLIIGAIWGVSSCTYKKFFEPKYLVSFETNGGSEMSTVQLKKGAKFYRPLDESTKQYYTLKDWYYDEELENVVEFPIKIYNNITFYAKWELATYTLTYETNGGSAIEPTKGIYTKEHHKPDDPVKDGSKFAGWYNDSAFITQTNFPKIISKDTTIYAKWATSFSLIFDLGLGSNNPSPLKLDPMFMVTQPTEEPELQGYRFDGWLYMDNTPVEFPFPITQDTVIVAKWVKQYNIVFNANYVDATYEIETVIFDEGAMFMSIPDIFTREGWAIECWNKYSDGLDRSGDITFPYIVSEDLNLYAQWVEYATITWNTGSGSSAISPTQILKTTLRNTSLLDAPENPIKSTFTFLGWCYDNDFENEVAFPYTVTGNITFYAKFVLYNVLNFNVNGGVAIDPIYVLAITAKGQATQVSEITISTFPTPVRENYRFDGWYDEAGLTNVVTAPIILNASRTLYAKWVRQYTAKFELYGGAPIADVVNDVNSVLTLPTNPTYIADPAVEFGGWYTNEEYTGSPVTTHTLVGDVTFWGKWNVIYTVTFHTDGGLAVATITQNMGYKVHEPSTNKSTYRFDGWFKDATFETPAVFPFILIQNENIYAKFVKQYTVSFDANGGSVVSAKTQDTGTTVTAPQIPVYASYRFLGWFTEIEGGELFTFPIVNFGADVQLYAHWVKQYSFTYNGPAEMVLSDNSAKVVWVDEDTSHAVLGNPATAVGQTFVGWFWDSAFTQPFPTPYIFVAQQNMQIYAKFNVNSYTINFNSNGGSSVSSVTQNYGTSVSAPTKPSRSGYAFIGWFRNDTLSPANNVNFPYTLGALNETFYAKWLTASVSGSFSSIGDGQTKTGYVTGSGGSGTYTYAVQSGVSGVSVSIGASTGYLQVTKTGHSASGNVVISVYDSTYSSTAYWGVTYNLSVYVSTTAAPPAKNCIATGTMITLGDGNQVAVEDLTGDELLRVWNLFTGEFDVAPIIFIDSDPTEIYEIIHLYFSDGTDVKIMGEHGFYDVDLNQYVMITAENAFDYLGHWFVSATERVQLVNIEIYDEITEAWSPVTFSHLCYYVNGLLSMPGSTTGFINIFVVDIETMTYDAEQMANDIELYGLFTYEDFAELIPVEIFYAFNGQYLSVAMGKGLLDWEMLTELVDRYARFLLT